MLSQKSSIFINIRLCQFSTSKVFDLRVKKLQWETLILKNKESGDEYYDYLRQESANRLADRLDDITKSFPVALELGNYNDYLYRIINENESINEDKSAGMGGIKHLVQCEFSPLLCTNSNQSDSNRVEKHKVLCDEEYLPFKHNSFDLVVSSMFFHWINDIPSVLNQVNAILKPDGAFIASMLGGSTLQELRHCFFLAEQERKGGFSPHVSPLAHASDIAALLQASGFTLPTIDIDTIQISYPDVFTLMEHLYKMGESSASIGRNLHVGRDTLLAMAAIYQELYGMDDGSVVATFEFINMIGWKHHQSQPKALRRGSAQHSMKDLQVDSKKG